MLCINQDPDTLEKTEQVGLMQHIYGQCTSAVVWLGPAAAGSDEVMEALNRIGKKAEHAGMLTLRKEHYINWPRPDPEGCRNAEQKTLDDLPVQDAIEFPIKLSKRSRYAATGREFGSCKKLHCLPML